MLRVMRDGYWRDVALHLLVVVLLGSALAWGLAWTVDTFFGDAVTSLVGEAGEYDVLVQVRTEQQEAAHTDLVRLIDQHLPGTHLHEGVSIAGQTYYFLRIPDSIRSAPTFESLGSLFESVPGFIGHTLMVEPSVSVSGLHTVLFDQAQEMAEGLPEVAFTFRHGDKLVAVLHQAGDVAKVQDALNGLLGAHELIEVRIPVGSSLTDVPNAPGVIERTLTDVWGPGSVHSTHWNSRDGQAETFVTTLTELRRFLVSYATQIFVPGAQEYVGRRILVQPQADDGLGPLEVQMEQVTEDGAWGFVLSGQTEGRSGPWVAYPWQPDKRAQDAIGPATVTNQRGELAATLDESVRLLSNLSEFAGTARESVAQADAILAAFDEAVGRLNALDQQIQQLEKGLVGAGSDEGATPTQALLAVLVSGWLNRLSGGAPAPVTEEVGSRLLQLDLPAIEATLRMLAEGVTELAELNVDAVIGQIEQMQRTLPLLSDEEIAESVQLIDKNLAGGTIAGDRVTVLAEPGVDIKGAEQALERALDMPGVRLVATAGGVISPNARAALAQILGQVRELVAAVCAVVIALLVLFLDYSVLFTMEREGAVWTEGRRRHLVYAGMGAVFGVALVGSIALLSGGQLPVVGWPGLLLTGALLGAVTAMLAPRISPIDRSEVVAGDALGLSHSQIMREIVVPSSRPGLFNMMNRWKQAFR